MENSPKVAFITVYESSIYNADSPSGYQISELESYSNELERLGFSVIHIDPILNEDVRFIIESTIIHSKRVDLISNTLKGKYDYILYLSIKSSYTLRASSNGYKIDLGIRLKRLTFPDDIEDDLKSRYDLSTTESTEVDEGKFGRMELKRRSLYEFKSYILNFFNKYVKEVRNYEYLLEGSEPICYNFIDNLFKLS
jgi:hypothetical protein